MIDQNDMSGGLAADVGPALSHLIDDVAITDGGADQTDTAVAERNL